MYNLESFRAGMRGVRVVTNVERNAGSRDMCRGTSGTDADGEVVWSWRAHAGAKWAAMCSHRADDGGKRRFTGESTK
jgi:hypothetical protein